MAVFDTPQEAFGALRPVCVQLTRAQTLENVGLLRARLAAVSAPALQELQEYVLFPLRFALRLPGPQQERLAQSLVQCISAVLAATCLKKPELLRELFSELCSCLSPPPGAGRAAPQSEELKLAVIQALHTLLHAARGDVVLSLYQPSTLPLLGFAVSLLLGLAEQEKAKQIKVSALGCLQVVVLQCGCQQHRPLAEEEQQHCGDLFASFLPGMSLALARVITGDTKQGHKPAVCAIRLLYLTLGSVMADAQLARVPRSKAELPAEQCRVAELMVHRGPEWSQSTAAKLSLLLQKVVEFSSVHPHWKVRLELVELVQHLLRTCSQSLVDSFGHLLKALVGLLSDDDSQVQSRSQQVLRGMAEPGGVARSRALADVLAENLHSLATALPRLMSSQDDRGKVSTLSLLLGYLKLLGPKVDTVLKSRCHLQRLGKALVQVLELDVSPVKVVEERQGLRAGRARQKQFRFFAEEKVAQLLQQVCRLLGYHGNLYLLVDHFMGLYGESGLYRKQAAMVLNELVTGAAGLGVEVLQRREAPPDAEELTGCVVSILDEYTDQANWDLPTGLDGEETGPEEPAQRSAPAARPAGGHSSAVLPQPPAAARAAHSNAWQLCVQLEGMGCCATALGAAFRPLLRSALCPLLEKAGDGSPLVSEAALGALRDVCQACGYPSARALLADNADYLADGIALGLRQAAQRPRAARVLGTMLSLSDASSLPLLEDVLQEALAALDHSYAHQASTFLGVLHSLMAALACWFGPCCGEERGRGWAEESQSRAESQGQQLVTGQELEQFFLDYIRQKQVAEGDLPDTEDEEADEAPPLAAPQLSSSATEGEAPLPSHAQLAKAVMERCSHLLSHQSLHLRLKVLEVLELCVTVLHPHGTHLLPLAHRAWPALLPRLLADDPRAVLRAFKVLCTLADKCGDFLRQRFSKDVLPKLVSSLLSQAPASARAGPVYSHTLAFKLQLAVLQGLGPLCEKLDLGESDLSKVADACLPYLSARQPSRLQEAAHSVFLHLMQMDPDSTWLLLTEVCCPQRFQPPHASLRPLRLPGMGRPRDEFTHNVQLLLERLGQQEGRAAGLGTQEPSPP
ncbi:TELO2-interacting protein 1 homolog [Pogoniulus pusillus]|uniref:TELO2-interacting protein 1 homolog n=1 Tax=Pogoniulus pusillus TaxID=488313 RepID=UPI0030B98EE0